MNDKALNYSTLNGSSLYKLLENIFVFLGLACFCLSLFLPIFYTSAEDIYGFWVFITGWVGVVFIQFAWFANPFNLLALLLAQGHPRIAFILSCLALSLASCSFIFYEIPTGINHEKVFIQEFGFGFYLWYAAQILVLLALLIRLIGIVKRTKQ